MKKILLKSSILFLINLSLTVLFLITDIHKYTTAVIYFLPIVFDIFILEKMSSNMTNKQKSYTCFALLAADMIASFLFGMYQYFFGVIDVVGAFMLFLYTFIFGIVPCLIFGFIYLFSKKGDEQYEEKIEKYK